MSKIRIRLKFYTINKQNKLETKQKKLSHLIEYFDKNQRNNQIFIKNHYLRSGEKKKQEIEMKNIIRKKMSSQMIKKKKQTKKSLKHTKKRVNKGVKQNITNKKKLNDGAGSNHNSQTIYYSLVPFHLSLASWPKSLPKDKMIPEVLKQIEKKEKI